MRNGDQKEFGQIIKTLLATFHVTTDVSREVAVAWWEALEDLPIEAVRQAVKQYIRVGKYPPKPADIRNLLAEAMKNQWFSAAEAWAHALKAIDESETVIWTVEASRAFDSVRSLIEIRDWVGARQAFEQAYSRYVELAIGEGRTPVYIVSEGWDRNKRVAAIAKAKALGFLPAEKADRYLAELDQSNSSAEANLALAMISGKVEPHPSASAEFATMMREAIARSNAEQAESLRKKEEARKRAKEEMDARRQHVISSLQWLERKGRE